MDNGNDALPRPTTDYTETFRLIPLGGMSYGFFPPNILYRETRPLSYGPTLRTIISGAARNLILTWKNEISRSLHFREMTAGA